MMAPTRDHGPPRRGACRSRDGHHRRRSPIVAAAEGRRSCAAGHGTITIGHGSDTLPPTTSAAECRSRRHGRSCTHGGTAVRNLHPPMSSVTTEPRITRARWRSGRLPPPTSRTPERGRIQDHGVVSARGMPRLGAFGHRPERHQRADATAIPGWRHRRVALGAADEDEPVHYLLHAGRRDSHGLGSTVVIISTAGSRAPSLPDGRRRR